MPAWITDSSSHDPNWPWILDVAKSHSHQTGEHIWWDPVLHVRNQCAACALTSACGGLQHQVPAIGQDNDVVPQGMDLYTFE